MDNLDMRIGIDALGSHVRDGKSLDFDRDFTDTAGMKAPAVIGIVVVLAALVVGGVKYGEYAKRQAEIEDMKSAYRAAINAYNANDGAGAVEFLSDKSFELYSGILKQALDAGEAQTKALPPHQLTEVLNLRTNGKRKDIRNLNGRTLVSYMVNNGMWAAEEEPFRIESAKLMSGWGELTLVDGEWADAYRNQRVGNFLGSSRRTRFMRSREAKIPEPVRMVCRMVMENGKWKVCDAGSGPAVDAYWRGLAKLEGIKDVELLALVYGELDDKGKLDPKIWRPMK
jgi:hypothetical protein